MDKHKKKKEEEKGKKKINTICLQFNWYVTVNRFMKPPVRKSTIAPTTVEVAEF